MEIHVEFERFIAYLSDLPVNDDVRRMAGLVYRHLDALAEVGSARRARSARLAPLAISELEGMPAIREEVTAAHAPVAVGGGRLHQLAVGPFRGFMREEVFDLSRDITLIYGANGTGKSSFCEAMELAMLGSISEAREKRLDQRQYCNNARLRRHDAPRLTVTAPEGRIVPLTPNEERYRFCFIEKNRLDDFARIAARTPGDQRQLIATLFGIDQFSEFVRGFNQTLDDNLQLNGMKALQLDGLRMQLSTSEQLIRDFPTAEAQLQAMEAELAQRIYPGYSFDACATWLHGTSVQTGRLPYLRSLLDGPAPQVYGITAENLRALYIEACQIQTLLDQVNAQLAARAGEVSFSQLYRAVLDLAPGATSCPACRTDLRAVAEDPFARARHGLAHLADLAALEQNQQRYTQQLRDAMRALWENMGRAVVLAARLFPTQYAAAQLPAMPADFTGVWLHPWMSDAARNWNALLELATLIEHLDASALAAQRQRAVMVEERTRLDALSLEVERLRTRRATANEALQIARQQVAQFEHANQVLIGEVAVEAGVIAKHGRIKAAYDGFLASLQDYLTSLPSQLLQGLGERARNLYNSFNRDATASDQLHALWLPLTENGKIEVEFAQEPGTRFDALFVLSEGHIKCLGLSILLAKNIELSCPYVIFDDVVNAIDDEHRNGIWRTFFEDGHLDGKQIILTSHAEEFLLRIEQELGAERAAMIKRYKFLPRRNEYHLRVDSAPPSKNYVLLAEQAIAQEDKRSALQEARPALESLTDRAWTWLGRRGDGRLELRLSGPRAPLELNNKCTKLRSAFGRIAEHHAHAGEVVAALDRLLGVNGQSIEWGYLNGGVHDAERSHEFDPSIVRAIVDSVRGLDAALARLLGN